MRATIQYSHLTILLVFLLGYGSTIPAAGRLESLGHGSGDVFSSVDYPSMSGDGNTLAYRCGPLSNCAATFGIVDLKTTRPVGMSTENIAVDAYALSPTGQFVVGVSSGGADSIAFQWSRETGTQAIADFTPVSISGDGANVIGNSRPANRQPVIWRSGTGLQHIAEYIQDVH